MNEQRAALRAALEQRFGEPVDVPDDVEGVDALLRIARWTTHREWSARPVGPDTVRLLAACALSAPSKSFLQQADIVDVRDPAQRRAVEALVPSMPWMRNAPALLVFLADGRRFRRLFAQRGQPFANEHLDGFFNPVVDASLVMMNFIAAASAAGLACCPISVLRDQAATLGTLLALPEHVVPVAGLCVGHPVAQREINPRLPLSATLHTDRYDDRAADAAIEDFDRRYVEGRARFLPAGAPRPPARWSDERAKQYAQTQRGDWGAFVRGQGFGLE